MAETQATTPAAVDAAQPKVTLHWLDESRAQRIVWLLDECKGCESEIKVYKRGSDMRAPKELKQVHPLGKSPLITVTCPARPEGLVIAESSNMTEYLCEFFARHLIPQRWQAGKEGQVGGETESWLRYRYYVHYNEGTLMTLLLIALMFSHVRDSPQPFFVRPITRSIAGRIDAAYLTPNFESNWTFLEEQLRTSPDGGEYLCGPNLTAADILMSFPLIAGKSKVDKAAYPLLAAYTARLENHDGYIRSIKRIEEVTGETFKAAASR